MIGVHNSNGADTSPTPISPQRYEWLHAIHIRLSQGTDFFKDLQSLMLGYTPKREQSTPKAGNTNPPSNGPPPPTLQRAIQLTFQSRAEIFASPLNCSMEPGITCCTADPENFSFGALNDAFSYRLTGSCTANPEYDPGDMRKAILHALASSTNTTTPFLVGHGPSRMGGYPLVLRCDTQSHQPGNTHPNSDRTNAICPGPQTFRWRCNLPLTG